MEEFVAKGVNGQLTVVDSKIVISRKGALSFLTQGIKGDKEIRIPQISSIQFKRAGTMLNGYIQFAFLGGRESKSGILDAAKDENTIVFNRKQEPDFLKAKEIIESKQG